MSDIEAEAETDDIKVKMRSKAEVMPEVEAYFKRYHLIGMNAVNATGTAGWWLHSWLEGRPTWMLIAAIPLGSFVASYLFNKLQRMSTIASLRTYKQLAGPVTNWLNWVLAVIWLPLSFAQYVVTIHYPKNFFWYVAAVNILMTMAAGRVDKALAKR